MMRWKRDVRCVLVGGAMLLTALLSGCDSVTPPEDIPLEFPVVHNEPMRFGAPIWHPDGNLWMVHHRPLDEDGTPIDSLAGVYTLRPDGSELTPFMLCKGPCPFEVRDWAPSGDWVVAEGLGWLNGRLQKITYPDGEIEDISSNDQVMKFEPSISPDGRTIAYIRGNHGDRSIALMNADGTGHRIVREIPEGILGLAWGPGQGELTYVYKYRTINIIDTISGNVRQLRGPVRAHGVRHLQWSPDRLWLILAYDPTPPADFQLWRVNSTGTSLQSLAADRAPVGRWSPDSRQISYTRYSHNTPDFPGYGEIWLMNADGSNKRQITRR